MIRQRGLNELLLARIGGEEDEEISLAIGAHANRRGLGDRVTARVRLTVVNHGRPDEPEERFLWIVTKTGVAENIAVADLRNEAEVRPEVGSVLAGARAEVVLGFDVIPASAVCTRSERF